jgi:hypothetical protein
MTSLDPAGGAANWTPVRLDTGVYSFRRISCPSANLCVAIDGGIDVYTSTDPTGGAAKWTAA